MVDEPPGSRITMRWEAGSRFGPYLLKRLLGRGGFGEVYEALDTTKNRRVALKMLAPAYSADPGFRKRLFREARSTARLNEAHVVPIHDYGEIDGQLYIDMRLVPGADLASVLAKSGPLDPARAVQIVGQIASALDAAHAEQIIHRDVKPANILLARDDYACLVDFGLANAAGDTKLTSSGITIGTFAYLAPERLDQSDVGAGADIYALACVLSECVTGSPPYTGDIPALISAHLTAPIPRPSRHHPGIPAGFDDVIAAGMAKNPLDRYASAGELAAAARQVLAPPPGQRGSETTVPANQAATLAGTDTTPRAAVPGTDAPPSSAPSGPAPSRGRVRTTVVLAVVAMVVVVVAVVGYMLRTPPSPNTTQHSSSSGVPAIPTSAASAPASYGEQIELPFPGLVEPNDVAVDITGAVYVTNTFKNAVLKLAPHASAPVELPFTGLFNPEGLAVDGAGNVYVADSVNQRVVYLAAGSDSPMVLPFTRLGYAHGVAVKILDRTVYAVAHEPTRVLS